MQHFRTKLFIGFALLLPLAAGAQSGYTVTDLGSLDPNGFSYANGINNSGQVVGYYYTQYGNSAFVYSNGKMTDLGNIGPLYDPSHTSASATGINDSGQIAGGFTFRNPTRNGLGLASGAFLFQNGQMQQIGGMQTQVMGGLPTTTYSGLNSAYAINNAGQIAGIDVNDKPALYQNGITTELNLSLDDPNSSANVSGLNNKGVIVGGAVIKNLPAAYYYQNGVQYALPNLPSATPGASAFGINDQGQITGSSGTDAGQHAVIWQNGQITDINVLPGTNTLGIAINNNGVVAGDLTLANGKQSVFAYQNGQMTDILAGTNWLSGYAKGINDAGDICGWGSLPNGFIHAFLAVPNAVPEPGSLLTCAVGVGVLALAAHRRKRSA